ncbi:MAG: hypothetical protein HZB29_09905 [Nitrospinae bacterium]|nr:hypothetical protein [Nitrospinota bacterium]
MCSGDGIEITKSAAARARMDALWRLSAAAEKLGFHAVFIPAKANPGNKRRLAVLAIKMIRAEHELENMVDIKEGA